MTLTSTAPAPRPQHPARKPPGAADALRQAIRKAEAHWRLRRLWRASGLYGAADSRAEQGAGMNLLLVLLMVLFVLAVYLQRHGGP